MCKRKERNSFKRKVRETERLTERERERGEIKRERERNSLEEQCNPFSFKSQSVGE
jgi:hypothetical protein